jgi:transcriptional regulator with XRE-family HTH domain
MTQSSLTVAHELAAPPVASRLPIGLELRRLRRCRGLSQREMAKLLGLSAHSAVADYENGKRLPAGDIIVGYERVFGIPDSRLQVLRGQELTDAANAEYEAAAARLPPRMMHPIGGGRNGPARTSWTA